MEQNYLKICVEKVIHVDKFMNFFTRYSQIRAINIVCMTNFNVREKF
jgi:hypothetical protein